MIKRYIFIAILIMVSVFFMFGLNAKTNTVLADTESTSATLTSFKNLNAGDKIVIVCTDSDAEQDGKYPAFGPNNSTTYIKPAYVTLSEDGSKVAWTSEDAPTIITVTSIKKDLEDFKLESSDGALSCSNSSGLCFGNLNYKDWYIIEIKTNQYEICTYSIEPQYDTIRFNTNNPRFRLCADSASMISYFQFFKVDEKVNTVENAIAKSSSFPTNKEDGWVNESGTRLFLDSKDLILSSSTVEFSILLNFTHELNDNYEYNGECSVKFNMDNEVLTSVTVSDNSNEEFNGTYVNPLVTFSNPGYVEAIYSNGFFDIGLYTDCEGVEDYVYPGIYFAVAEEALAKTKVAGSYTALTAQYILSYTDYITTPTEAESNITLTCISAGHYNISGYFYGTDFKKYEFNANNVIINAFDKDNGYADITLDDLYPVKLSELSLPLPETSESAWVNENKEIAYLDVPAHALHVGNIYVYVTDTLSPNGLSYVFQDSLGKVEFIFENGELTELIVTNDSVASFNGSYKAPSKNKAIIGEEEYETLQDAFDTLDEGVTITLLNDSDEVIYISKNVNFVFNLNGNTFTGEILAGEGYHLLSYDEFYYVSSYQVICENVTGGVISGSNKDLYIADAHFSLDENTVIFDSTLAYTAMFTVTPNEGYEFSHWVYKIGDSSTPITITEGLAIDPSTINGNLMITPVFISLVNTVTFDLQGHGEQINEVSVNRDEKVAKPVDPTCEGYTFGGWFKDKECTNAYDFDSKVNEDTTLYALWTALEADPTPAPAEKGLSTGAVIGIVAGSVAGLGAIAFVVIFILKKKKL